MSVARIIDHFIARGGQGTYGTGGRAPELMVVRRLAGTLDAGEYTPGSLDFFFIHASVRPDTGAVLADQEAGRYSDESRIVYTRSAELWPQADATPAQPSHEADVVILEGVGAFRSLATLGGSRVNTVVSSRITGEYGNDVTFSMQSGSSVGVGELDETAWPDVLFAYKSGVTTIADMEEAIAASSTMRVRTASTAPLTVLDGGDHIEPVALAGGTGESWRVTRSMRYRAHWKAWIERLWQR